MNLHVYTICWNEEELLPFFLKHYERFAAKIVAYDNMSTDRTAAILDSHPLCERRVFDTGGKTRDDVFLKIKNGAWAESRRKADWVIVCDADEFIYHPDLPSYLASCAERGITIPRPTGFSMVSDRKPEPGQHIWEQLTEGRVDLFFSKKALFDPNRVKEINYGPGAHTCQPHGIIKEEKDPNLKLLHYKYIGGVQRTVERRAQYSKRTSLINMALGWGVQTGPSEAAEEFHYEKSLAKPVDLSYRNPGARRERKRIVFFSGVGGFSSLARISALARSLDSGEYDVVICGDARAIAGFERESRTLIPISCLSPDRVNGVTERGAPLFDMETIEKHIWEDLRIIRRTVPDVVVGDMRQSLTVSCKLAGLPHVNVINAQWSPYARASFELPVQQAGGAFGFEPIARMIASAAAPLAFACHVLPLNLVRSKYGLPPADWNMKHSYSAGDFVVYPDIENIVPARGLPDNHLYLGAVLENSDARLPDWWDEVPADRPIVHLNLGDLGERRLQQIALDTLGRMPLSVICSTTPFGRVPNPPANAYMADYLPGVGAAKRSQLVICNGGNFAAQHALAGSAPVLGVISNMDQRVFTKALKSRGAAEFIEGRQANQPALERMVYQMLQRQSYRMAAERLSVLYESAAASLKFKALIRRAAGDAVTDTVTARGAL